MHYQYYIQTAANLLHQYNGSMPLQHYLKQYFAANKKHGSRDRKTITHFCYAYYRLGNSLQHIAVEEKIFIALFLVNDAAGDWLTQLPEPLCNNWEVDLNKRIELLHKKYGFNYHDIFSFKDELSCLTEVDVFIKSHLVQPYTFIRIRNGKNNKVINTLLNHNIFIQFQEGNTLGFDSGLPLQNIIDINKDAVIQDASSQKIINILDNIALPQPAKVWDCCAASGGKSILLKDYWGNIQLTVSDIRASILHNLQKRLAAAAVNCTQVLVANVAEENLTKKLYQQPFHVIVCDVPCTGSGTWSRTPENLVYFDAATINAFTEKQKKIVTNAYKYLQNKGYLLYITCSVFKKENEQMVLYMQHELGLNCIEQQIIEGYHQRADTMFVALLQKN